MSVHLSLEGKLILYVTNSLFYSLHERMIDIVEEENIQLTFDLEKILERLDQETYGGGCVSTDLSKHSKEDFQKFADLIARAIKEEHADVPFNDWALEQFLNFHKAVEGHIQDNENVS